MISKKVDFFTQKVPYLAIVIKNITRIKLLLFKKFIMQRQKMISKYIFDIIATKQVIYFLCTPLACLISNSVEMKEG